MRWSSHSHSHRAFHDDFAAGRPGPYPRVRYQQSAGGAAHAAGDVADGCDDGRRDRRRHAARLDGVARRRLAHEFARAGTRRLGGCLRTGAPPCRATRGSLSARGRSRCSAATRARCSCSASLRTWESSRSAGCFDPTPIRFDEAIPVAVLGLVVNVLSAWLLSTGHDRGDRTTRTAMRTITASRPAHHHDLNLRSAYLHVVADAATSVLAIVALVGGKYFGATWLDPVMGIVGTVLVGRWAVGLLRDTGRVLLDAEMDSPSRAGSARGRSPHCPDRRNLRDLHVWRVGRGKYACIVHLADAQEMHAAEVRAALAVHEETRARHGRVRALTTPGAPLRGRRLSACGRSGARWRAWPRTRQRERGPAQAGAQQDPVRRYPSLRLRLVFAATLSSRDLSLAQSHCMPAAYGSGRMRCVAPASASRLSLDPAVDAGFEQVERHRPCAQHQVVESRRSKFGPSRVAPAARSSTIFSSPIL